MVRHKWFVFFVFFRFNDKSLSIERVSLIEKRMFYWMEESLVLSPTKRSSETIYFDIFFRLSQLQIERGREKNMLKRINIWWDEKHQYALTVPTKIPFSLFTSKRALIIEWMQENSIQYKRIEKRSKKRRHIECSG